MSRLEIFHILFAQFSFLQIIKTTKRVISNDISADIILLLILILSVFSVHFYPDKKFNAVTMYLSFFLLSLKDGSLSNHVVTSCTVCLLMLATSIGQGWEMRAEKNLTVFVVILYLAAGIHKLNSGFIDPYYSCANLYVIGALSAFPVWVQAIFKSMGIINQVPVCAILFEFVMPLVIWFAPKWRRHAIVVGALFHGVLALAPSPLSVYPFSAIMLPIYVMLLPGKNFLGIVRYPRILLPFLGLIYAWAWMYASQTLFETDDMFEYPNYGMWSCSLVWNIVGWSLVIRAAIMSETTKKVNRVRMGKLSILILTIFAIFPLGPYLGIRNYPALAMFSNLRTEGTKANQFISLQLDYFKYQNDWVEITDTNFNPIRNFQINLAPMFPQKLKDTAKLFEIDYSEFIITPPKWDYDSQPFVPFNIPFIELRRHISNTNWDDTEPDLFVAFTRHFPDGRVENALFESSRFTEFAELNEPLSFFEKHFVKFRSFYEDYSPCRH